jgi:hypothetical protein
MVNEFDRFALDLPSGSFIGGELGPAGIATFGEPPCKDGSDVSLGL